MAENPQRQSLNRLPGRVLAVLLPLISVCYPLLWYWGRERGLFGWLALAMAAVWMLRAWWAPTGGQRAVAAVVAVFFAAAWLLNQPAAIAAAQKIRPGVRGWAPDNRARLPAWSG